MASDEFELAPPPEEPRERHLWLQHAAGFILFEDIRGYAREKVDERLDEVSRDAAFRAIDDALYGLMMLIDGVTGRLHGDGREVRLDVSASLMEHGKIVERISLSEGDGMCMGFHAWQEGDFGGRAVTE